MIIVDSCFPIINYINLVFTYSNGSIYFQMSNAINIEIHSQKIKLTKTTCNDDFALLNWSKAYYEILHYYWGLLVAATRENCHTTSSIRKYLD